ncbi:MAG: hypothetical protein GF331_16880 [Chitinivibrionales bacterium]|nr:hypothetical protein [Chitinivibrionales bacterium]
MMTAAQCMKQILLCKPADYVPNLEWGPMSPRIVHEWKRQGMPLDADMWEYFGLDGGVEYLCGNMFDPIPGVPNQGVIAETSDTKTYRDSWGTVTEWPKDLTQADGRHRTVRNAITSPDDWQGIRSHFDPTDPHRYPGGEELVTWKHGLLYPPAPVGCCTWSYDTIDTLRRTGRRLTQLNAPSQVGDLKEFLGFEYLCSCMYLDPELLANINTVRADCVVGVLERILPRAVPDILHFWEDIGFNNGPMLQPEMMDTLAVPYYRRIIDTYRSHGGEIVSVDSDGDIRLLMPYWLKAGVNHFWPMEVKANMDVVALRKEYGHSFSMRGGVSKYALLEGREAIDRELDRIAPVVQEGGYIPMLDHQIPVGVSFDNFSYYIEQKEKLLGARPDAHGASQAMYTEATG